MTTRRDFLKTGVALAAIAAAPHAALAQAAGPAAAAAFAPKPGKWRDFEVVTVLDVKPVEGKSGPAQAWVPLPSYTASDWMKPGESTWKTMPSRRKW